MLWGRCWCSYGIIVFFENWWQFFGFFLLFGSGFGVSWILDRFRSWYSFLRLLSSILVRCSYWVSSFLCGNSTFCRLNFSRSDYSSNFSTMSESSEVAQSVPEPVMDTVNKLPASQTGPTSEYGPGNRFLTKDKTVHQLLGGGRGKAYVALIMP